MDDCSLGSSEDELGISPPPKKVKATEAAKPVGKLAKKMKPASPAKPKAKGRPLLLSDEESEEMDYGAIAKRGGGSSRPGRGPAQKYVEIGSSSDGEDGSVFGE